MKTDSSSAAYMPPQLTVYGSVEELTRTDCYNDKTITSEGDDFWVNKYLTEADFKIGDCSYS